MCTCSAQWPLGEALHPHGVVEIARGFAVDGDDIELAKIAAAGELVGRNRRRESRAPAPARRRETDAGCDARGSGSRRRCRSRPGWPRISMTRPSRAVAVFAEIEDLGGDDHAVQVFDGMHVDGADSAHAIDGRAAGGDAPCLRGSRSTGGCGRRAGPRRLPLRRMRNSPTSADARGAVTSHDFAVGLPSRSMRLMRTSHAVAVHGARRASSLGR